MAVYPFSAATLAVLRVTLGVAGLLATLPTVAVREAGAQVPVRARAKRTLVVGGQVFKDLNGNDRLDPYEDWRLSAAARATDLLGRMTLEEKAGMLLINTLNAEAGGRLSERGVQMVQDEKMTRFIFRNTVVANAAAPVAVAAVPTGTPNVAASPAGAPGAAGGGARAGGRGAGGGGGFGGGPAGGAQVTPYEAAQFTNLVQEIAEGTRLGIPVLFKSNARNHVERDARPGINVATGAFSEWPKEPGLAATRDTVLLAEFGRIMRTEWSAIGLRGMYGYMADLSTEPRWYRVHETFTEDADLASTIIRTLVRNIQGPRLGPGSIALTLKHFPGHGPQEGGGDSHYEFGKNQSIPSGTLAYQLKPFKAAIAAGVSSIMPSYSIPVGMKYAPNDVGVAFSKGILTALLRDTLGFEGNLNSDTGIIGQRAWGLEGKSADEQIAIAVNAGIDVLSGFDRNAQIVGPREGGQDHRAAARPGGASPARGAVPARPLRGSVRGRGPRGVRRRQPRLPVEGRGGAAEVHRAAAEPGKAASAPRVDGRGAGEGLHDGAARRRRGRRAVGTLHGHDGRLRRGAGRDASRGARGDGLRDPPRRGEQPGRGPGPASSAARTRRS